MPVHVGDVMLSWMLLPFKHLTFALGQASQIMPLGAQMLNALLGLQLRILVHHPATFQCWLHAPMPGTCSSPVS